MKLKNYVIYLALLAICCAGVFLAERVMDAANPANTFAQSKPTLIVDAGHGGEDGGASGGDGTLEKNLNLQVSEKLRDFARIMGYNVIMVREEDISVHDEDAKNTRQRKRTDLMNRVALCDSNPSATYIGIHMNKFTQTRYSGTQVFYSVKNPASQTLAESIQLNVKNLIQKDNDRTIKKAGEDIYILCNVNNVAVTVECGFLSNPEELSRLKNEQYQSELVFAVMSGICATE